LNAAAAAAGGTARQVKWHPTRPYLLSAGLDRTVRAWDGRGGACLVVWTGHADAVLGLAVSPDGAFAASCGDDRRALVWDIPAE
jgi:WD40 repeat protein